MEHDEQNRMERASDYPPDVKCPVVFGRIEGPIVGDIIKGLEANAKERWDNSVRNFRERECYCCGVCETPPKYWYSLLSHLERT